MSKEFDQSIEDAKIEFDKKLDEFKAHMDAGTSDPDHFITIDEIEKEWAALRQNSDKIYSDIISTYMSSVDEKELIKRKKENT